MNAASPLRIALVALGGVNRWLFRPAIEKRADARLVAGVSPTAASRQSFAEKWPIPAYETFEQMMAKEKVDAVVIGSPNHLHLAHIRAAAEAGLHVLVTKPLCNCVADCRAAIAAARDAGVVLHVGHEFRYRPPIRRMIELARQGEDGPVGAATMLTMHMGFPAGLNAPAADSWRMDRANVPGGSGNLLGVHGIDLANALFGEPRRVAAVLQHLRARLPLEDTTAFTIEFDRAVAVVTSSYASQPREHACLFGTRGTAIARGEQLYLDAARKSTLVEDLPTASAADCLLDQFLAAARGGPRPETDGQAGLLAIAVLEAALLAAQQRRAVEVAEVL